MYKILNQIENRDPVLNPVGVRKSIKDFFNSEKLRSLFKVEKKLIEFCRMNQWREACAIAFIDRGTNQLIDYEIGDVGTFNSCDAPISYRKYLKPNIIQVVIHFHPSGDVRFSKTDNLTDSSRFFKRKDDWSYIIAIGEDGTITRSEIKKNVFL